MPRLDKILSNLKYGSRKDVRNLIKKGSVLVNNDIVKVFDMQVDPTYDKISVNGKPLFLKENVILSFYKPKGFLSSHKDSLHPTLFEWIKEPYQRLDLKIAGRLDLDSEGLMILTTDGDLIHRITHPKKHLDKVYEVILDKDVEEASLEPLKIGVLLKDPHGETYNAVAKDLVCRNEKCRIVIDEGKFHQVKLMFKKIGYEVLNLKRIQIGNLKLNLEPGQYQEINIEDIFGDKEDGN